MGRDLAIFLQQSIEREKPNLLALTDAQAQIPRGAGKWSPKQELGHLIDSASNNHIRFAGAAIQPEFRGPGYAQNDWVRLHNYPAMEWESLVEFWFRYNGLLVLLVENIPQDRLEALCFVGENPPVTLRFLIEDYIWHMQHHIDLLLRRENVTSYPGARAAD
jgi:hypothetical protein